MELELLVGRIESAILDRLRANLESRGKILEYCRTSGVNIEAVRISKWFDTFCADLPTAQAVQQEQWESLTKRIASGDDEIDPLTADAQGAIWKLWSEGNDLRQMVHRYELPPEVADVIGNHGWDAIGAMTARQLEVVLQEFRSSDDKAKIRRMWRLESGARETIINERATEYSELAIRMEEAKTLISALISEAGDGSRKAFVKEAITKLVLNLQNLEMDGWEIGSSDSIDLQSMRGMLVHIGKRLDDAAEQLLSLGAEDHETDESIIARSSAGHALYGICFGMSMNWDNACPPKQLFRPPLNCPLLDPQIRETENALVSLSIAAGENYRRVVEFFCGVNLFFSPNIWMGVLCKHREFPNYVGL